jgi:hypothetical protein
MFSDDLDDLDELNAEETFSDEMNVAMVIVEEERRRCQRLKCRLDEQRRKIKEERRRCQILKSRLDEQRRKNKITTKKYKKQGVALTEAYRKKYNKRNVASLQKRLVKWKARTGCNTVALTLLEGNIIYSGPPELEKFGRIKKVRKAFLGLLPKPKPESYHYDIIKGWEEASINEKRKMVVDIITHKGTKRPNWGKEVHQPHWWPMVVPFTDPNNGSGRACAKELNLIISAAENAHNSDDDDDDDDDDDVYCRV